MDKTKPRRRKKRNKFCMIPVILYAVIVIVGELSSGECVRGPGEMICEGNLMHSRSVDWRYVGSMVFVSAMV